MTKLLIDVEQLTMGKVELELSLVQYLAYRETENNPVLNSEFVKKMLESAEEIKLINPQEPTLNYGSAEVLGVPSNEEIQEYYDSLNPPEPEPEDTTNESIEEEEKLEDGNTEDQ